MSRAFALIRFNKTGNIYYGLYNGTSDILNPNICTPEECYDSENDVYDCINYLESKRWPNSYPDTNDWDIVEIYSDYGKGFWWRGVGSESLRLIKNGLDPWGVSNPFSLNNNEITIIDEMPQWVQNFLSER